MRSVCAIQSEGVPVLAGPCPEIYRERAFIDAGLAPAERLPGAATLGQTCLMFLVHPTLTDSELETTCDAIRRTMSVAGID